jgi:hypothetical protein
LFFLRGCGPLWSGGRGGSSFGRPTRFWLGGLLGGRHRFSGRGLLSRSGRLGGCGRLGSSRRLSRGGCFGLHARALLGLLPRSLLGLLPGPLLGLLALALETGAIAAHERIASSLPGIT